MTYNKLDQLHEYLYMKNHDIAENQIFFSQNK